MAGENDSERRQRAPRSTTRKTATPGKTAAPDNGNAATVKGAPISPLEAQLSRLEMAIKERSAKGRENVADPLRAATDPAPQPAELSEVPHTKLEQLEFFYFGEPHSPRPRDLSVIMDVAVFRLSKVHRAENTKITHILSDGQVVVTSGPHGMATIWDWDIVIMAASHATYGLERGMSPSRKYPGRIFRPRIADILRFLGREYGGRQAADLRQMLLRLNTTHVYIERKRKMPDGSTYTFTVGENLIHSFKMIEDDNGKPHWVEIHLSDLIYTEIVEPRGTPRGVPRVLMMNKEYFSISSAYERFVYRLARRTAGVTTATYSFKLIHERSGSSGELKRFVHDLRKIIKKGPLLEYDLQELKGKDGPLLQMTYRTRDKADSMDADMLLDYND